MSKIRLYIDMNELIIFEYGPDNKPVEEYKGQPKKWSNSTAGDLKYLEERLIDFSKQFPTKKFAIVEEKKVYSIIKSNTILTEALKKVKSFRTESIHR